MIKRILTCITYFFLQNSIACECDQIDLTHCKLYQYDIVQLVYIDSIIEVNDSTSILKVRVLETFFNPFNLTRNSFFANSGENCSLHLIAGDKWILCGNLINDSSAVFLDYCGNSKSEIDKSFNSDILFLKNYKSLADESVCNISEVDVWPDVELLDNKLFELLNLYQIPKPIYFQFTISIHGEIENLIVLKNNNLPEQFDETKIKEIMKEIDDFSGVKCAKIKSYPVNVRYVARLG